jgi:homoserine kinase
MIIYCGIGIRCVCFVPDVIGKTSVARAVLSDAVTREDAVFNIGRVAWLVNALAHANFDSLRYGMEDR